MKKFFLNEKYENILISLISIFSGLFIGGLIMIAAGFNPIEAYGQMITGLFSTKYSLGEWLVTSAPIILTGVSVAFAFRAGLFNIGAEGQFVVGMIAGTYVGLHMDIPGPFHIIVVLIAAGAAGAL